MNQEPKDEKEEMQSQRVWGAKLSLFCYFSLAGGILVGAIAVGLVLFGFQINYLDLPFPVALVQLPVNEGIFLGITLLFARHKGASLKALGLKRASTKILVIAAISAIFLFFLALGIAIGEEIIFGPDPMAESLSEASLPNNAIQLVILVALSLLLVGPIEELAFRGFVQKGFENSFGKMKGLLIATLLFGLLHGLNTPYAIAPVTCAGLVLGYIWQRTNGNTTVSALTHGVYNSIVITLAYFATV